MKPELRSKIEAMLANGYDPAAVSTILRCRFVQVREVMASMKRDDPLAAPVCVLDLPYRTVCILEEAEIETVGQLLSVPPAILSTIKNCGPAATENICNAVREYLASGKTAEPDIPDLPQRVEAERLNSLAKEEAHTTLQLKRPQTILPKVTRFLM